MSRTPAREADVVAEALLKILRDGDAMLSDGWCIQMGKADDVLVSLKGGVIKDGAPRWLERAVAEAKRRTAKGRKR